MQIYINGEMNIFDAGMTITGIVQAFALDTRKLAIERNQAIVPRSLYAATVLCEGDQLEIVQFIGGG